MERKEAISRGLAKYNTGRPCRRGHLSDRHTSTGGCVECLKAAYSDARAKIYGAPFNVAVRVRDEAAARQVQEFAEALFIATQPVADPLDGVRRLVQIHGVEVVRQMGYDV